MNEELRAREEARQARYEQLYTKPVNELVRMIVDLEEENKKTREYRNALVKIRNIVTPPEERRKRGRPTREEELI